MFIICFLYVLLYVYYICYNSGDDNVIINASKHNMFHNISLNYYRANSSGWYSRMLRLRRVLTVHRCADSLINKCTAAKLVACFFRNSPPYTFCNVIFQGVTHVTKFRVIHRCNYFVFKQIVTSKEDNYTSSTPLLHARMILMN